MDIDKLKSVLNENKLEHNRNVEDYFLYNYIIDNEIKDDFSYQEGNYFGLMFQIKLSIEKAIYTNIISLSKSGLVSKSFSKNVSTIIYSHIVNFYLSKSILFEESIILNNDSKLSSHDFIIEITNSKEWRFYYFKKYPILYFSISNFIENQISYISEILSNISKDIILLQNKFHVKGKLETIELFKGDLHNHNKSVSFLLFEDGGIYYKPRNFDIENIISPILNNSDTILKIPNFVSFDSYGYQEAINCQVHHTDEKDSTKTLEYFLEIGKCIKLIYELNIEDIINDNVIFSNNYVYLIDLECILIQNDLGHTDNIDIHNEINILKTGTLPIRYGVSEYCSSIFLPTKLNENAKVRFNIDEQVSFFNHTFSKSIHDKHLPPYYYIENFEHYLICIDKLIDGFKSFEIQNEKIKDLFNIIDYKKTRVIFRETIKYFELLSHLRSPNFISSKEKYLNEAAILLPKLNDNDFEKTVLQSEYKQILRGDIPSFYITSKNLYDSERCIFERAYGNRNNFQKQVDVTNMIKEYLILNLPDEFIFKYYFNEIKDELLPSISKKVLKTIINFLFNHLYQISEEGSYNWVNIYINKDKLNRLNAVVQDVGMMKGGLFDGIDGLIYFLYKNINCLSDKQKTDLFLLIKGYLRHDVLNNHNYGVSILSDEISKIVTFLLYNKKSKDSSQQITRMESCLLNNIINSTNISFDFVAGITSTVIFISNNKELFSKRFVDDFTGHLINSFQQQKDARDKLDAENLIEKWSASSNLFGQILFLNSLNDQLPNDLLYLFMKRVQQFESDLVHIRKQMLEDSRLNISWLTGLNGVVTLCLILRTKQTNIFLDIYYDKFINNINYTSFSLSGGNLGTYRLLTLIAKNQNKEYPTKLFNELFNLKNDHIVKSMIPKGIFNGIGGFLEIGNNDWSTLVPDEKWLKI